MTTTGTLLSSVFIKHFQLRRIVGFRLYVLRWPHFSLISWLWNSRLIGSLNQCLPTGRIKSIIFNMFKISTAGMYTDHISSHSVIMFKSFNLFPAITYFRGLNLHSAKPCLDCWTDNLNLTEYWRTTDFQPSLLVLSLLGLIRALWSCYE